MKYWIEFEVFAREFENFYKYFEFEKLPCFDNIEQEYLSFMTSEKHK